MLPYESAHPELYEAPLAKTALNCGMMLVFGLVDEPFVDFEQGFDDFLDELRGQWSAAKAPVQFLGYSTTRGFCLFPLSDDEETMDVVFDQMPTMLDLIFREMRPTLYFFLATGELPGHPEVLIVGGATAAGERVIGWLDIARDSFGNEHLGLWNPLAKDDDENAAFFSSWMMRLLELGRQVH
jgi:hypothetical protein